MAFKTIPKIENHIHLEGAIPNKKFNEFVIDVIYRKILTLVLFLVISCVSFGQFSIGIKTGIEMSKINSQNKHLSNYNNSIDSVFNANSFETKLFNSLKAGLVCDYKFNSWYSLNANLEVKFRGGKYFFDDIDMESIYGFFNVNLPVTSRFHLNKGAYTFYSDMGLNLSYDLYYHKGVARHVTTNGQKEINLSDDNISEINHFKKFDMAILTGIGLYLNVGNGKLFLNYRHAFDILNSSNNENISKFFINSASINSGYMYTFKKK